MNALSHFDALHPGPTWRPWRAFVAAVYGEPLDDEARSLFSQCTGRQSPREGGYPEAVCIVGVQSGKTSVAGALASHAALTGERGTHALLVGQDHRGAMRALLRYAREPFEEVDAFRGEVARSTADSLELNNGCSLSAYPCRPAAVRGIRASIVCIDELAFFTSTDGRPTDSEMLRVARGRVATTSGKLIILSSPYWQAGALWELHRRHHGEEDSPVLVWQASAPTMNPCLAEDYLARMREEDPEAAQSEVEGLFRSGLSTLFDVGALDAVTPADLREQLPARGCRYVAHFDPSGGRRDAAALAIAHRAADGTGVLDLVRAWPSPHNPAEVIAKAAAEMKRYSITRCTVDRFAGEFPAEQFRLHKITAEVAKATTSDHYLALLPLINSRSVTLLDDADLLRELRGLERRAGAGGKDLVSHRRSAHDDRAAAAAAVLVAAATSPKKNRITWGKQDGSQRRAAMLRAVRGRQRWARALQDRGGPSAVDLAFPRAPAPRPRERWPDPPRHADADHGGTLGASPVSPPADLSDPFDRSNRYR
ncbi:MAG TPA: terminase family protein [Thermoanaerobaculia bacterium]|nr:terminase family protein [Thermoanaerobaculia bacterium]